MRILRLSVLALPLVALAACTTAWNEQPVPEGPQPVRGLVRVTRTSGDRFELQHVHVAGDSLFGEMAGVRMHPRVGIALAEVSRVETADVNASGAAILVVLGLAALWALVLRHALLAD